MFTGFVNTILSWSALVPLSRLTYCIYLVHIMILDNYIYNLQSLVYITDSSLVRDLEPCINCTLTAIAISQ